MMDSQQKFARGRFRVDWRAWMPSRGNILTIAIVVTLLVVQNSTMFTLGAPAASQSAISTFAYQGRLADAGGTPLTGTYSMIFRLYNAPTGGSPLWDEQWTGSNSVQVSDGLFNVMLGSLNPIPQSIVTGSPTLYLGLTVNTDNEMSPRVQLGSVPYAFQALTVADGSITKAKLAPDIKFAPENHLSLVLRDPMPTSWAYNSTNDHGWTTYDASSIIPVGATHAVVRTWIGGGSQYRIAFRKNGSVSGDHTTNPSMVATLSMKLIRFSGQSVKS